MKKTILFLTTFLLLSLNNFAQNNIQLNIDHKLGNVDFEMNTGAKNNIDNDFDVTRLQYYISEIAIVHDGGTETVFDDVWVLVDASSTTQVDLGDSNINTVEMVKLHIGVDEAHNHLDPTSYAATNPLSPQFPSMHWGWNPGYRFVAFEGNGGSRFNQLFQLHGLGDDNYFTTEIPLTTEAVNNKVLINIDADYTRALENINVSNGIIIHGDYGEARQCLENFRDYVFAAASETVAAIDVSEISKFDLFPNPTNGKASILLEGIEGFNYQVSVTDILGKQVLFFDTVKSNSRIELALEEAGLYFVHLIKDGHSAITKKLISK